VWGSAGLLRGVGDALGPEHDSLSTAGAPHALSVIRIRAQLGCSGGHTSFTPPGTPHSLHRPPSPSTQHEQAFDEQAFNFYVHAPARTDPSCCPPGGDALTVLVPVPLASPKYPPTHIIIIVLLWVKECIIVLMMHYCTCIIVFCALMYALMC